MLPTIVLRWLSINIDESMWTFNNFNHPLYKENAYKENASVGRDLYGSKWKRERKCM